MLGPNITGIIGGRAHSTGYTGIWAERDAFYLTEQVTWTDSGIATSGVSQRVFHVHFSANKSNSIYGSSSTVQPKAISLNVLIKF